jgi:hypothetical protein
MKNVIATSIVSTQMFNHNAMPSATQAWANNGYSVKGYSIIANLDEQFDGIFRSSLKKSS